VVQRLGDLLHSHPGHTGATAAPGRPCVGVGARRARAGQTTAASERHRTEGRKPGSAQGAGLGSVGMKRIRRGCVLT
jgi:hypothetical protein